MDISGILNSGNADLISAIEATGGMGPGNVGQGGRTVDRFLLDYEQDLSPEQRKKMKAAKDFESLFLHEILKQMQDSIPDSELFEDSTSGQIDSMFVSFLSQGLSEGGGLGLWRQIYEQMPDGSEAELSGELDAEM